MRNTCKSFTCVSDPHVKFLHAQITHVKNVHCQMTHVKILHAHVKKKALHLGAAKVGQIWAIRPPLMDGRPVVNNNVILPLIDFKGQSHSRGGPIAGVARIAIW